MIDSDFVFKEGELECPKDCPFLGQRTFLPDTLPFYCNKYETFLGQKRIDSPLKCARCLGVKRDFSQEGMAFISAYTGEKAKMILETQQVFLQMNPTYQHIFVDFIAKTGAQIALTEDKQAIPETLLDAVLLAWKQRSDTVGSPEYQEFKTVLDQVSVDFPLMARETQTLLMNLFMVMDNSEKEMLKHVLQNARQIESFLDSFSKQPQDRDLLRNMRALLYDYDRREKIYQQEVQRQQMRETQLRDLRIHQMRDKHQEYQR